jgi:hypothetical protein
MALSTWVAAPLILASITRETRLGSLRRPARAFEQLFAAGYQFGERFSIKCPQSFLSVDGRGDVAEILHRIPNAAPVIEIVGTRPSRIVVCDFVANTRAIARASSWSFSSGTIRLARPH